MSSYRPPPLENHGRPENVPYNGGRRGQRGHYSVRRGLPPKAQRQMPRPPMLNPFGPPSDSHYIEENNKERDRKDYNDNGPVIAFVSGVGASIDDEWIKKIFGACCKIATWRRAYDSDERPQSFGFCEFQTADDAVRAIRVLSGTRGLQGGGWVLPDATKGAVESKPLSITVDVSVQNALDAQLSMLESQDDVNINSDMQSALDAVKNILKELEESLNDKQNDSEIAKPNKDSSQQQNSGDDDEYFAKRMKDARLDESRSGNADHKDDVRNKKRDDAEHEAGSEAGDDMIVVSLEDEEAWEKEKLQKNRYRRYVVAAEEREHRMAKEQADREERLERSTIRELDRIEERQRARDAIAEMLLKWDDKKEKSLREHEYYRDRERWWHHRKDARAREIELDDEDRRREEREKRSMLETEGADESVRKASSLDGIKDESAPKKEENALNSGAATNQREKIKALIKEIPADTDALFAWPLKWEFVDEQVLSAKIEPAVSKRLTEYLGSDADDGSVEDMTGFIVSHIRDHNSPSSLAGELEMVLVDEASVFVARIWRVVVYESEARARGLV
ncbi:hypothetical protein IW140_000994 [Coemansia sp. RSA 1813]|nr:hypothetical protein IW138_001783 [Coemansia sp. RSA 986]KAJ2572245.1 hypothetical protein IW140_000994 [Coemansia sp. RSA 1813]